MQSHVHQHCQLKGSHIFIVCITYMYCGYVQHYCSCLLSLETQLCSGTYMAARYLLGKTLATLYSNTSTACTHVCIVECWGLSSFLYMCKVSGNVISSLNRAYNRTLSDQCVLENSFLLYTHIFTSRGYGGLCKVHPGSRLHVTHFPRHSHSVGKQHQGIRCLLYRHKRRHNKHSTGYVHELCAVRDDAAMSLATTNEISGLPLQTEC